MNVGTGKTVVDDYLEPEPVPVPVAGWPERWHQWTPPSVEVVLKKNTRGCKCHGTGNLGTWSVQENGYKISREIPCPCLHVVIPKGKFWQVKREIDQHFQEVKNNGTFCQCRYCDTRRKQEAQENEKSNLAS